MGEVLKDRYGHKIGEIRTEGNKDVIYDAYGHKLGWYDGKYTYDKYGHKIGQGDLLTTLL